VSLGQISRFKSEELARKRAGAKQGCSLSLSSPVRALSSWHRNAHNRCRLLGGDYTDLNEDSKRFHGLS